MEPTAEINPDEEIFDCENNLPLSALDCDDGEASVNPGGDDANWTLDPSVSKLRM